MDQLQLERMSKRVLRLKEQLEFLAPALQNCERQIFALQAILVRVLTHHPDQELVIAEVNAFLARPNLDPGIHDDIRAVLALVGQPPPIDDKTRQ